MGKCICRYYSYYKFTSQKFIMGATWIWLGRETKAQTGAVLITDIFTFVPGIRTGSLGCSKVLPAF